MGLDIYVGGLARYYSGNWETVMQRAGRAAGHEVIVARDVKLSADPTEAYEAAVGWRDSLCSVINDAGGNCLVWSEEASSPYFTDKIGWPAFGALSLAAAYSDNPNAELPTSFTPQWGRDPIYEASVADGSGTRFPHLLCSPELWLPGNFMPVRCSDPLGDTRVVSSTAGLISDLLTLNANTWDATPQTANTWSLEALTEDAPLDALARFGFAVLLRLALESDEHVIPMKLDY
jgi:hypothetical protein